VSPKVNVVLWALVLACNGFWLYSPPEWRLLYKTNDWPDIILRHLFFSILDHGAIHVQGQLITLMNMSEAQHDTDQIAIICPA